VAATSADGVALSKFSRRNQALNASGTQFIGLIHGSLRNLLLHQSRCWEVMHITINQSGLNSSVAGHVLSITKL
jgi:hypothetical protein